MKKLLTTTALMAFGIFSYSQSITPEVLSNGGDFFSNSNVSIAYTIGEPVTETAIGINNTYTLTQGFHQGLYTLVNIEKQIINTEIKVYPNPSSDYIFIEINNINSNNYKIKLFDNLGQLLLDKQYENCKQISLQQFANSTYYLKVVNTSNDKFDTYKILKK